MRTKNYLNLIKVDQQNITPLYKQLANGIIDGIETGRIVSNDVLPSLHDLCSAFDISRGTVEKAYPLLKAKGFVDAVPGKGYYLYDLITEQRGQYGRVKTKIRVTFELVM